jgi:hypothetical protein
MTETITYNLSWTLEQTVNLPEGSTVITGMIKDSVPTIWVKQDPTATLVPKQFKFFETKDEGYTAGWHYVCTVNIPDPVGDQSNLFMQK